MVKQNLFIDFDDTIVNSTKAFCDVYNMLYCNKEGYVFADWTKTKLYNLRDVCTLLTSEDVKNIFRSPLFWDVLEFYEYAIDVLGMLNEKYNPIIASLGTLGNLSYKAICIKENLPFIDSVILLKNSGTVADKSMINMKGGIFIDDVLSNLKSSNADVKYVYGVEKEYNITIDYPRFWDWRNVGVVLG